MKVNKVPDNYTNVSNKLLRSNSLSGMSKLVVTILLSLRHGKSNTAYPSMRTLASECGLSVNSVQKALNQLVECNVISITKSTNVKQDPKFKASNIYTFKPQSEWKLSFEYLPSDRF